MILGNANSVKRGSADVAAVFSGSNLIYMTQADTSVLTYQINDSSTAYSITGRSGGILYGHLNLPSTYNGLPVTAIADGTNTTRVAFFNCDYLRKVTIPSSITSIGSRTFNFSDRITTMILHNNISSIGFDAFRNLQSLVSITLPNMLTTIENRILGGCTSLPSITIPSNVTSIGDFAFGGCTSLNTINCMATSAPTLGSDPFNNVGATQINVPTSATGYGTTYGGLTVVQNL